MHGPLVVASLILAASGVKLRPVQRGILAKEQRTKADEYNYPNMDDVLLCVMKDMRHKMPLEKPGDADLAPWQDPELGLWLRAQAFMMRTPRMDYLDVGCGMGRVVAKFGGLFALSTCLEPDASRIAQASEAIHHEPFAERVSFLDSRFLELEAQPESYDVITCVQVIQHLPLAEPQVWFEKMHSLLRPSGVLIVATTIANQSWFRVVEVNDRLSASINASDFDARAKHTTSGGGLPVHKFTLSDVAEIARSSHFRIVEHNPFSFVMAVPISQYVVLVKDDSVGAPVEGVHISVGEVHTSQLELLSLQRLREVRSGEDHICNKSVKSP